MPPRKKPGRQKKTVNAQKNKGKKPLFRVKNEFDSSELSYREKRLSQAKDLLERGNELSAIHKEGLRVLTKTEKQDLKNYQKWFLNHHEKWLAKAKNKFERGLQLRFIFRGNYRPLTEKEKKELREYEDHFEKIFISGLLGDVDKKEMRNRWKKNNPGP